MSTHCIKFKITVKIGLASCGDLVSTCPYECKGHFPLGGIFRAERHFLLFKDQLAESGRQKTKENIIPRGKFRLVENGPKIVLTFPLAL